MATNFSLLGTATAPDRQFNPGRFFSFRYLVTVNLMKVIYIVGMAIITLFGLFSILSGLVAISQGDDGLFGRTAVAAGFWSLIFGFLWMVFGNLFWRIACETWVVLFSMHEILGSVEKLLQRNTSAVVPSEPPASPVAILNSSYQAYASPPPQYEAQAAVPPLDPLPVVPTSQPSLSGHVCRNCGGWVKAGVKFCGSCGTLA